MKFLGSRYALHQLVFIRAVGGVFVTLIILKFECSWGKLRIDKKFLHFSRCIFMVSANLFYFTALVILPLADAPALFFLAPVFVSILSSFILKEAIGLRRIAPIILAFVGTTIVICH